MPSFKRGGLLLLLIGSGLLTACGSGTVSAPAPPPSLGNVQSIQQILAQAVAQDDSGGNVNPCSSGSLGLTTRRSQSTFTTTLAPVNCQLASRIAGQAILNGNPSLTWTTVFSAADSGTVTGPSGGITVQYPYSLGFTFDCTFPAPGTSPATATFTQYGAYGSLSGGAYVCDNETYTTDPVTWSPTPPPTPTPKPTP